MLAQASSEHVTSLEENIERILMAHLHVNI